MTKLLLRLFIKNHKQTDDPSVRSAIGKLGGTVGIVLNLLLCSGKLIFGVLSGSVSVTADALNNLSDAASAIVTLWGFHLAQKPADEDHPYGHARYEYLSGLVVSALILVIGMELAVSSTGKIIHPLRVDFSFPLLLLLFVSALLKGWMALFYSSLSAKIHSTALRATARDSLNDMLTTGAILICGTVQHFTHVNIDGFAGLAVAIFIIFSGLRTARETVTPLLGARPDAKLSSRISALILSYDKVLGIHDLMVHDYGPGKCFATVHTEISAEEDALTCHDVIDRIEREVFDTLNVHLVIHHDPFEINDGEQNRMRQVVAEIVRSFDESWSVHDFRLLREAGGKKLVFDLTVPFALHSRSEEIKSSIDAALRERGFACVTVIRLDGSDGGAYSLR